MASRASNPLQRIHGPEQTHDWRTKGGDRIGVAIVSHPEKLIFASGVRSTFGLVNQFGTRPRPSPLTARPSNPSASSTHMGSKHSTPKARNNFLRASETTRPEPPPPLHSQEPSRASETNRTLPTRGPSPPTVRQSNPPASTHHMASKHLNPKAANDFPRASATARPEPSAPLHSLFALESIAIYRE